MNKFIFNGLVHKLIALSIDVKINLSVFIVVV